MTLALDDPRHGTENGYTNLGCRCDRCREAWRVAYTKRAHRLGYRLPLEVVRAEQRDRLSHGESGYRRGCRCLVCKTAATEARRRRRLATSVPCSHGCGRMVDSQCRRNPDKPYECNPCSLKRIHAERRQKAAA